MFTLDRRSRNERMYIKFPWLWAVTLGRCPAGDTVTVTTLESQELYQPLGNHAVEWWVHVVSDTGADVLPVVGTKDMRLADGVIKTLELWGLKCGQVAHLVSVAGGLVTIRRPPGRVEIREMCEYRATRPERRHSC